MNVPSSAFLLVCAGLLSPAAAAETPPPGDARAVVCTFSNPAYAGHCTVSEDAPRSVSAQTACRSVLACLNSVRCVTKTYCNATTVRGGWKLVSAKDAAPEARTAAAPRGPGPAAR